MNTYQFLAHLRSMNIELAADGGRLRVNAPEGVLTRELQVELASRKADILRVLDAAQSRFRSNPPPIHRAPRDGVLPPSLSQQRLWFLDQLNPGQSVYNAPMAYRIRGAFDVAAMERALNELVRRHEMLRTTFQVLDGQPRQQIATELRVALPVTDLTEHASQEREHEASHRIMEDARAPFDLLAGPLLRCHLYRLGAEDHILYVNVHHIAFDVWSHGIFAGELKALYDACSTGDESPLAELPVQYADYAQWQREWLASGVTELQLGYWTKQLDGIPPLLELPIDRPRTGIQTYNGAVCTRVLPGDLSESLRRLARRSGATPFMVMLTALQTLLYRYTGQSDVVVGTVIANRRRDEIEGLIGFFVNSLALRTDLSGNPSFRDALARVREMTLEAYDHQDLPFERLVEELQPERTMDHAPIFQVMLAFQNAPKVSVSTNAGGLTLIGFPIDAATAKFDLSLYVDDCADGFELSLEYNTDLFDAGTAKCMLLQYQTLLESIVTDPDTHLADLRILTPEERQQLLADSGRIRGPGPVEGSVVDLFEAQVVRSPHAVALVFEGEELSYAELDRRGNRLACHLRALGVGPGALVGLCVDRGLDVVVGIVGILKAGGAYLPLDPDYPQSRIEYMISDSQAELLVTRSSVCERLGLQGVRLVDLDGDGDEIERFGDVNPAVGVGVGDRIDVIYTSGSTGQPKGVEVTHGNVARLFTATREWFRFDSSDVWTLFHSYAFDFSVWEMWGALLHGGRLEIVSRDVSRSAPEFLALLRRRAVTVLNQTPSAFMQLMHAQGEDDVEEPLSLRWVVFGGEALDPRLLQPWFERHGDERPALVNMYGITEVTVHVTYRRLRSEDAQRGVSVIGDRIPDLQLYILDVRRQPVPVGVPGEVYVGGAGVALGYLNRPRLTAERFVLVPFDGEGGGRLYRSGDLARRRADGDIEYLGRLDNQVKVRGYRIELGEVEAALVELAGVRQCAVLCREDGARGKLLVGYVVPERKGAILTSELRLGLRERLPEYSVPSAFVLLETLPLTANGKVDRAALPGPGQSWAELEVGYVAPRTELEAELARIWVNVLAVKRVGVHDNFFELGGHSLMATQVVSRIRDAFGVALPVINIFESQTVAGLAQRVENIRWVFKGREEKHSGGDRLEGVI